MFTGVCTATHAGGGFVVHAPPAPGSHVCYFTVCVHQVVLAVSAAPLGAATLEARCARRVTAQVTRRVPWAVQWHAMAARGGTATRRLAKELRDITRDPPPSVTAAAVKGEDGKDNLFHWRATIIGPADSPYEDGAFQLDLEFPTGYPFQPLKVRRDVSTCIRSVARLHVVHVGAHCASKLPRSRRSGEVPDEGVPPQHQERRQHLPGHPEGALEPIVDRVKGAVCLRRALGAPQTRPLTCGLPGWCRC